MLSSIVEVPSVRTATRIIASVVLAGTIGVLASSLAASEYTPDDLYRYQYLRLQNGLDVFLKMRPGAHNVSIRMVVHVGSYDFSCGTKETPHFLEHLLFTGTSRHSESELDALIEDNGGSWNASTGGEKTVYEVDIHDRYSGLALDTLYEILTDSTITGENVERTRDIIHREAGGKPSVFRRWIYGQGIGHSAQSKADELLWPAVFNCQELETADGISREEILKVREHYYVPNNMALVVVGNFEGKDMLARIRKSFGQLKSGPVPGEVSGLRPKVSRQRVTGTFSPILGTEGQVALNYQSGGYRSDQVYSMILVNDLLKQEIFRELRVEKGLAYAPSSSMGFDRDVGVIALSSDAELGKMELVEETMLSLVERIRHRKLEKTDLERIRRRVLLTYAQGYEDNSSIASHYASVWRRFEKNGNIVDLERKLMQVSHIELSLFLQHLLDPERVVIAVTRPTLSYHRLYILLSLLALSCVAAATYYWWKYGKRRQGLN